MTGLSLEDLEALYATYGANVLHRCKQILRDEELAWDAMHQVFVRAIRHRQTYRGDAKPLTWLFSIALRVSLDLLAKADARPMTRAAEDCERSEELLLDTATPSFQHRLEQQATVAKLLSHFDAETQEIVVMRYFDELEVAEIAARTSLGQRTVARRLQAFLELSRKLLGATP